MDKTAIEQIQKESVVTSLNNTLNEFTDDRVIAVPDGFSIKNLEQFRDNRNALRGKMSTSDMPSFVNFVTKHLTIDNESLLTVHQDQKTATCILDFKKDGLPGHCLFLASFRAKTTAAYVALVNATSSKHSQTDFANFLLDNRAEIQPYDIAGDSISISNCITAVRNVTVAKTDDTNHNVGTFTASKSSFEKVDAKSGPLPMPETFDFVCQPYMGFASRVFSCRVTVYLEQGKAPSFGFKIINLDKINELIGLELQEKLVAAFSNNPEELTILMGSFDP